MYRTNLLLTSPVVSNIPNPKTNLEQSMKSASEVLGRAGTAALIGGIGSIFFLGESGTVPLLGMNVYAPAIVGGAMATASIVNDGLHDYVLSRLPGQSPGVVRAESLATGFALSSIGVIGALKLSVGLPMSDYFRAGVFGFSNKLISDWSYDKLIFKKTGGYLL